MGRCFSGCTTVKGVKFKPESSSSQVRFFVFFLFLFGLLVLILCVKIIYQRNKNGTILYFSSLPIHVKQYWELGLKLMRSNVGGRLISDYWHSLLIKVHVQETFSKGRKVIRVYKNTTASFQHGKSHPQWTLWTYYNVDDFDFVTGK